jgi:hypothetical protein
MKGSAGDNDGVNQSMEQAIASIICSKSPSNRIVHVIDVEYDDSIQESTTD